MRPMAVIAQVPTIDAAIQRTAQRIVTMERHKKKYSPTEQKRERRILEELQFVRQYAYDPNGIPK